MKVLDKGLVTFIDIEASGIDEQSYPIEVGFYDTEGNSESFKIRPIPQWKQWDKHAEQLHGISRKSLFNEGVGLVSACQRLNELFGCEVVYSHYAEGDRKWLKTLYDAVNMEPSFLLADIYDLQPQLSSQQFITFTKIIRSNLPPHRGLPDAKRLADAFNCIRNAQLLADFFVEIGVYSLILLAQPPFTAARTLSAVLQNLNAELKVSVNGVSCSKFDCVRKNINLFGDGDYRYVKVFIAFSYEESLAIDEISADLGDRVIVLENLSGRLLNINLLQSILAHLNEDKFRELVTKLAAKYSDIDYAHRLNTSGNPFGIQFLNGPRPTSPSARMEINEGKLLVIFEDGLSGMIVITDDFFQSWYVNQGFYERDLWACATFICNHLLVFNHSFALSLDEIYKSFLKNGTYIADY